MGLLLGAFGVLTGAMWAMVHTGAPNDEQWGLMARIALTFLAFAAALLALRRVPARRAVPVVVLGGLVLQIVGLTVTPRATDDFYRYIWDGRVQAAGIDPYRYSPVAPELAGLRDPWLFPERCREQVCTRMNHPTVNTIYPPVAQAAFVAVHYASPEDARERPIQVFSALLAMTITVLLVSLLRRARRDPRHAAIWAWCPLTIYETANNAHIDVLAVLLTVLALAAVSVRRHAAGGALLGLAVATKVLPALVLPAMVRRAPVRVIVALLAACALVYLPHLLAVGTQVLGFLPDYLQEEGYSGTRRWVLLRSVLPDVLAPVVGIGILGAVSAHVALHGDDRQPWDGAALVTGSAFLLAGPPYPWYALQLLALAALARRPEWVAVGAAMYVVYFAPALQTPVLPATRWAYGSALAVVLLATWLRATGRAGAGRRSPARKRTAARPTLRTARE